MASQPVPAPPQAPIDGDQVSAPAADQLVPDGESNVSPEEQAEYELVMNNALELMYVDGEDGSAPRPEVLEAITVDPGEFEGPKPEVMALAQSAVTILTQLDDSAREAGKPISDDVLYHAGLAIIEELAEIADATKVYDYTEEDMTGAFAQAIDLYRPKLIADGRTDEETLKGQFAEINEAESQGRLGEILPGLEAAQEPPVA